MNQNSNSNLKKAFKMWLLSRLSTKRHALQECAQWGRYVNLNSVCMMSLCLTADPDCHIGQSKGRYRVPAFNPTRSRWLYRMLLTVWLFNGITKTLKIIVDGLFCFCVFFFLHFSMQTVQNLPRYYLNNLKPSPSSNQ